MTDNNGNLRKQEVLIPNSDTFAQFYSYDSLNRLEKVNESKNGAAINWQQQYVYDRYGNRTIDQTNTWGTNIPKPNFGVDTATNRLTAPSGYTMSYDAAGNQTNDTFTGEGGRTYDGENRMKQAWANNQWQTYSYDGDGRRVKRLVNGIETWQVYGLGGELLAEYAANAVASTPQKEYGYRNGQLLITAEPGSGGSGSSGPQPVTWTNAVGVTVNGNSLTATGNGWNTAGASSSQSIASGDGYVGFTASETTSYRLIGLSQGDTNQNYDDIDFAIYLTPGGTLSGYQGSTHLGTLGTYTTGDVLRVAVEGGVVKYKKNGSVFYTSSVAPSYPLLVDTSLYNYGSTLTNVVISSGGGGSGGGAGNVGWTNTVGVSASTNNLTKTAAAGWGNAGAVSTQTITSGDGYVEFTASETTSYRLLGLSHTDTNQSYDTIDYAVYLQPNGSLGGYQGATFLGSLGTYATGDVLRVAIEGGVVKYRKNGTLIYTSTVAPTYPLMVDTSLYTNGATINNVVLSGASGGGSSLAQIHWLVTDHLGTPRMIFDQTGSLANMSRHDYLPFGEEIYAGTGGRTAPQGYTLADNIRQKFTSKERDNESGLDYFLARYYSSTQGRFTSVDPVSAVNYQQTFQRTKELRDFRLFLRRLENPQTWNAYAYSLNNPLRFVDPNGEEIVTNQAEVNEAIRKRKLEYERALLTQYAKTLAADIKKGKLSSKEAIDKFYDKAMELTGKNAASALLIATGSALDLRSDTNLEGRRGNIASRITEGSLGGDTLHHFFINAFNNYENPIRGPLVTWAANRDETDPEDRFANSQGARFGELLAEPHMIAPSLKEKYKVESPDGLRYTYYRDPLRPSFVIP
jgi:RHS repeat-associated protein